MVRYQEYALLEYWNSSLYSPETLLALLRHRNGTPYRNKYRHFCIKMLIRLDKELAENLNPNELPRLLKQAEQMLLFAQNYQATLPETRDQRFQSEQQRRILLLEKKRQLTAIVQPIVQQQQLGSLQKACKELKERLTRVCLEKNQQNVLLERRQKVVSFDQAQHASYLESNRLQLYYAKIKDKPFLFLDLYPEIRNMIYEMLLIYNDELKVYSKPFRDNPFARQPRGIFRRDWTFTCLGARAAHPALLRACKKIHDEASGYLYDSTLSYNRDYYGTLEPPFHPPLQRPLVRNLTIFLGHWCKHEAGQVASLVKYHSPSESPLKTLRIVMDQRCRAYSRTGEIGKVFLPLKGMLDNTKVQFVNSGRKNAKAARDAIRRDVEVKGEVEARGTMETQSCG